MLNSILNKHLFGINVLRRDYNLIMVRLEAKLLCPSVSLQKSILCAYLLDHKYIRIIIYAYFIF